MKRVNQIAAGILATCIGGVPLASGKQTEVDIDEEHCTGDECALEDGNVEAEITAKQIPVAGDENVDAYQRAIAEGAERFRDGQYRRARVAFERAHSLSPVPELIFNIASTYRREGNDELALATYERFLSEASLRDRERRWLAQQAIAELQVKDSTPSVVPKTAQPAVFEPLPDPFAAVSEPTPSDRPWYRDGLGATLTAAGSVGVLGGASLLVQAQRRAESAELAPNHGLYAQERRASERMQLVGAIGLALGGASVGYGVYRLVREEEKTPILQVGGGDGGLNVSVSGEF